MMLNGRPVGISLLSISRLSGRAATSLGATGPGGGASGFVGPSLAGAMPCIRRLKVSCLDQLGEGRMSERLGVDLTGFSRLKKELLAARERDAEGFLGFVGDVHAFLMRSEV